jgi:phosphopantothenoylcysteine decarboxylase/phosphopantothenate--cysteine ligase, prokaryotic
MLRGKTVILGVTGGIAAYKTASLASMLVKLNCNVHVIMTANALNFINPIVFETLTSNKCLTDTFDRNFKYDVEHIELAKKADLVIIAPATANIIGKIAGGIADDMLSTTILACECKKIIVPTMNTRMFNNEIVQNNICKLERYGFEITAPVSGYLACGDIGEGKMPEAEVLLEYILKHIAYVKDMKGVNILVTAGPTAEALDPVRFISNHSTGKMGYAIAKAAMQRGAEVTLVSGKTYIEKVPFVKHIDVFSAKDMFEAVKGELAVADVVVKAAAVADYRPKHTADNKIKKSEGDSVIELERTVDILAYIGKEKRENQYICGFSMETENMLENSRKKLVTKNVDMIVANNLKEKGAGFAKDTNVVTIITSETIKEIGLLSKIETAHKILDNIMEQRISKNSIK